MNIHRIKTLAGPNIFSHRPMLAMELDLGELYSVESFEVPGFVDRLLEALPGLADHHCAFGKPGGFIRRLHEGTYFGHIVEHVALELTLAAGIPTTRGKTVATDVPGRYLVAAEYSCEKGMRHLLETAVGLVDALVVEQPYPLESRLEETRQIVSKAALGPSTKAIVDAATRRGIPWARVNDQSRVRLGLGKYVSYVDATITSRTSSIAVDLASDKDETKQVLRDAGLPVPAGSVVSTCEEALAAFKTMACPVVVKPLDGNQGRGVSMNLRTREQVVEAFEIAARISPRVIIEEMLIGNDYRVVMVNGRMVAAAQRIPAHVRGDGRHSIRQLVDLANHDPRRGEGHEKPMTKIHSDPLVLALLKRHGWDFADVPAEGEMVMLRESANLSTGGEARDVTDLVHPTVRQICERTARTIGLDICGVDLVAPGVEEPFETGGIVEVNAAPGIRMHHHPAMGESRDVGGAIIDMLYPKGAPSRIPVIAITGTNGKTTVTRMIGAALGATGRTVGMTGTDGISIGGEEIATGDLTGPWSARVVLSDPSVDVAVLETARGGIMSGGLGFDWADVAVITNIQADHIGQDGIEGIEDIARIKRLVAERVREGGTLVLNADDEQAAGMADHPRVTLVPKRVIYFSLSAFNPLVRGHVESGGTAFVINDGWIEVHDGSVVTPIIRVESLPATLGGTATYQTANILAATAAASAVGVSLEAIVAALAEFGHAHNSGRMNIFALRGGHIVLDYAHNPAALRNVCETALRWNCDSVAAVVGLPGDRADDLIRESARAVAIVDRVIIREDDDLRGRAPGAVAEMIRGALASERPALPIETVLNELAAIDTAIAGLRPGAAVLLFVDDIAAAQRHLLEQGAVPDTAFRPSARRPHDAAKPAA